MHSGVQPKTCCFWCRYNTLMKLFFIAATLAIIYQMRFSRTIRGSYDRERDTFRYEILVAASVVLGFFVHERIYGKGWLHYLSEVCLDQRCSAFTEGSCQPVSRQHGDPRHSSCTPAQHRRC
jgi:ER lumen protein retaining receptor